MTNVGYLTMGGGWAVEAWFWASAPPPITSTKGHYIWSQDQQQLGELDVGARKRQGVIAIFGTTGYLHVRLDNTNSSGVTSSAIAWTHEQNVCDSNWHHVAVTMATDRKTMRVFLDGEKLTTQKASSVINWVGGGVSCFGGQRQNKPSTSYGFFDGRMAYCAFKNAFVPDSRIQEHYAAGAGNRVFHGDDEVERIERILDWAEVPSHARALDPALVELQGFEAQGANALAAIRDQAKDAGGYVFADGQATTRYHNRRRRYNRFPVVILSEAQGMPVEANLLFEADYAWIFNDIRGKRSYGPSFRMENQQSRNEFGRRIYKIELNVVGNQELRNAMFWFLTKYKDQHIRVPRCSLVVVGADDPLLPYATCGYLDIGDKLVIDDLPENSPESTMEFFVEGISVEADANSEHWETTFALSPGDQDYVWQLDSSEWWGALDDGAPLAY